ncbi:MAG: tyrosine-type recombinase/integrase [Candidatus Eisenbacteria bacterium]
MGKRRRQFRLAHRPDVSPGRSPYRLEDAGGREVPEVNEYLDAQACRGLSILSLRAYGYSLRSLWRWISETARNLANLEEAHLLDFIRFQKANGPAGGGAVAAKTINHRLTAARCLYRYICGRDLPRGKRACRARSHPYYTAANSAEGYLHPARSRVPQLRVKTPRRVVMPLTSDEVNRFFRSLRTQRDLSIVALMLFCGLRSREVIGVKLGDLDLVEGTIRIRGKGDKERVVPLPPQVVSLIQSYLEVERPPMPAEHLLVVLKGRGRGRPMTPSGLRSLFRYHRVRAKVPRANPHRMRHTFGRDMARAGMSLPALMRLMGHSGIQTTMQYVALSPQDVWEEFQRVVKRIPRELTCPSEERDGT